MKYSLTITMFILAWSSYSQVDHPSPGKKKLFDEMVIFGGPSLSSMRGHMMLTKGPFLDKEPKVAYSYGFGFVHALSERANVVALLYYEKKGVITKQPVSYWDDPSQSLVTGQLKNNYNFDTYTANFLWLYTIGKRPIFNIGAGPFVSYLKRLLVMSEVFAADSRQIGAYTENQDQFNRSFDFGISAQLEMRFPISKKLSFSAKIVDNFGLADIRKSKSFSPTRTNNLNFLVGIIMQVTQSSPTATKKRPLSADALSNNKPINTILEG